MTEVRTKLDGAEVTLRCTLRAARDINSRFGNFTEAYRRLTTLDFEAYVAIVAVGLGKTIKEVEDDVFATGLPPLVAPLTEFLSRLSNGGNLPKNDASEEGAKTGEG